MRRQSGLILLIILFSINSSAQNVGIGTLTPKARLHIADSSVLFTTGIDLNFTPNPPVSGSGARFMWFAQRIALRAGYVSSTYWDRDSIGVLSFAVGLDVKAKGEVSIAMGQAVNATGLGAVGIGSVLEASGDFSIALGFGVSTNGKSGSFAFGDFNGAGYIYNDADNQFVSRFTNGYKFYLDNTNVGLAINPSGAIMVNNSTGAAGQVLTSNGPGASPSWKSSGTFFVFDYPTGGTPITLTTAYQNMPIINGQTFTLTQTSNVAMTAMATFVANSGTIPQEFNGFLRLTQSGVPIAANAIELYRYMNSQPSTFIADNTTNTRYYSNLPAGTYTLDYRVRKMNSTGGIAQVNGAQVAVQVLP